MGTCVSGLTCARETIRGVEVVFISSDPLRSATIGVSSVATSVDVGVEASWVGVGVILLEIGFVVGVDGGGVSVKDNVAVDRGMATVVMVVVFEGDTGASLCKIWGGRVH